MFMPEGESGVAGELLLGPLKRRLVDQGRNASTVSSLWSCDQSGAFPRNLRSRPARRGGRGNGRRPAARWELAFSDPAGTPAWRNLPTIAFLASPQASYVTFRWG